MKSFVYLVIIIKLTRNNFLKFKLMQTDDPQNSTLKSDEGFNFRRAELNTDLQSDPLATNKQINKQSPSGFRGRFRLSRWVKCRVIFHDYNIHLFIIRKLWHQNPHGLPPTPSSLCVYRVYIKQQQECGPLDGSFFVFRFVLVVPDRLLIIILLLIATFDGIVDSIHKYKYKIYTYYKALEFQSGILIYEPVAIREWLAS